MKEEHEKILNRISVFLDYYICDQSAVICKIPGGQELSHDDLSDLVKTIIPEREKVIDQLREMIKYMRSCMNFVVHTPEGGFRKIDSFSEEEKEKLRPMAETLAMMNGNAFFCMEEDDTGDDKHFWQYLPEADAIYQNNGGDSGWAGLASFARKHNNK